MGAGELGGAAEPAGCADGDAPGPGGTGRPPDRFGCAAAALMTPALPPPPLHPQIAVDNKPNVKTVASHAAFCVIVFRLIRAVCRSDGGSRSL
ncbi:MAG: hypothetical protein DLM53_03230 [Candidatus Eremiobacter antarcticus]|nr:MAG: hypothetical protein DLM53_03230 [Candidatus Eremiobacter sp. RRmetagenome_bin22]